MNESKEKLSTFWRGMIHDPMMTRQIFRDNEIRANLLIAKTMLGAAGVILLCWLLNSLGVLEVSRRYALPAFLGGSIAFIVPAAVTLACHGEKSWIKYMLLAAAALALAFMDSILTFNTPLLIVFPVVFSCRYYSGAITVRTIVITTVLFALSAWCGAVLNFQNPDLNFASAELSLYVREIMLLSFLPRWLTFLVISAFCFGIARYGRKMVMEQDEISQKTTRVNTELEMAGRIQSQALPTVASLPEDPFRRFDLSAEMIPAKEVGGDFYDFFYPDPSHLALIIADVADKGIAASLYMMMSKTLLSSRISQALSPGQVLESINRELCANSPRGMFVTVWLGILDLETGVLRAANAGHEYPILRRSGGDFELFKDPHGFVLGGHKGMKFPEYSLDLHPGDTLFVYTDGVAEANGPDGQMFGLERTAASLNRHRDLPMAELIDAVHSDIRGFMAGTPQFDDITMLAFQLNEPVTLAEKTVEPVMDELYPVQEFIRRRIGPDHLPAMEMQKIGIAVDEIFSNIVKYSEAHRVQILCDTEDDRIRITFRDDGIPFDPLASDLSAAPTPKRTGGMGIYITRKIMDRVEYSYRNDRNELTVILNEKENAK